MIKALLRQLPVTLLMATLVACGSGGADFGPTIADLEELPPVLETAELEPQANFEVDHQKVIQSFRDLVEITAAGGGTGDELRRLADLELELSLDDRISDDARTQQQGQEVALHAIGIYEEYLKKYPARKDNDVILYQLSRAYALDSKTDKSNAMLYRIARYYPNSQYMDEVQFRRGESLFVEREYLAAEQAYGKVVHEYPDSVYYEKALYKYGWTQFKQSRYREALASYTQLLDLNFEQNKIHEIGFNPSLPRDEKELLEDVVRVVSLSFTYQEEKYYISKYFKQTGKRAYEPLLYLRLGELYLGQKRIIDGSDLFLAYTKQYPYSSHTPLFHQRAIETFQQAGYSDLVLKEKIAFVDRYDVNSEYWSLQEPETQQALTKTLVLHMTELGSHFHALARASKKPSDYRISADWYRRFLKSFPEDPAAPRMNFLLAENLYDAGQYRARSHRLADLFETGLFFGSVRI